MSKVQPKNLDSAGLFNPVTVVEGHPAKKPDGAGQSASNSFAELKGDGGRKVQPERRPLLRKNSFQALRNADEQALAGFRATHPGLITEVKRLAEEASKQPDANVKNQ